MACAKSAASDAATDAWRRRNTEAENEFVPDGYRRYKKLKDFLDSVAMVLHSPGTPPPRTLAERAAGDALAR